MKYFRWYDNPWDYRISGIISTLIDKDAEESVINMETKVSLLTEDIMTLRHDYAKAANENKELKSAVASMEMEKHMRGGKCGVVAATSLIIAILLLSIYVLA